MTDGKNYIDNNFEYTVLTKIHDVPTYSSLKMIKDEIKANASSVQSDLGGGRHGYLGLVLTPAEYAAVSNIPFVRPINPLPLVIPAGTANYESTRLREDHKELRRVFRESVSVEAALTKQLVQALPPLYLKSFRNVHSNSITTSIPDILAYLFTTYGAISEEELENEKENLKEKIFDITQPLIILFNEIEDLQELATASHNAFTDSQMVSIGIKYE